MLGYDVCGYGRFPTAKRRFFVSISKSNGLSPWDYFTNTSTDNREFSQQILHFRLMLCAYATWAILVARTFISLSWANPGVRAVALKMRFLLFALDLFWNRFQMKFCAHWDTHLFGRRHNGNNKSKPLWSGNCKWRYRTPTPGPIYYGRPRAKSVQSRVTSLQCQ